MITVPERIAALGYAPDPALAWRVGAAIRGRWFDAVGQLPAKELRRKTSGSGSHCMAVYPPLWKIQIDALIHKIAADIEATLDHQLTLWEGYHAKL